MKQEIQNKLKELANLFLDDYGNHRELGINAVMNASFVFSSTLIDFVYSQNKDKLTQKAMLDLTETIGKAIRELIMASTGIDPKEHNDVIFK